MKKKITAMVLAVAMCCTLLVAPASAASNSFGAPFGSPQSGSFPAGSEDGSSWALWNSKIGALSYDDLGDLLLWIINNTDTVAGALSQSQAGVGYWNSKVDAYGVGSCSLVWLTWWADILNSRMNSMELDYISGRPSENRAPYQKLGLSRFNIGVRDDTITGYKRLYDYGNGAWVVDSNGLYPFYAPSTSTATKGYQWLHISDVSAALSSGDNTLSMTSKSALTTICQNLSSELNTTVRLYTWDDNFQCAYRPQGALVLCDNDGNPLMCPVDEAAFQGAQGGRGEDSKVIENPQDGGGEEIAPVQGNQSQVNYTTYQIVLPNGNTQSIDGCYFDNDGDAYVVQTQSNGLINTGDTIVNSYNTYEYTYNISYTTITYIGSSAEFTPAEYDVYYTLPDGRSSADLTKEDLEQLNLTMDIVSYQRSADDTRLRSLYHFDGNTEDASYWNYATSFTWNTGSSLTYLESNAFNGCLYLDELAHDFTIMLPSSLGSGDFTVDFRYYQSATASAHSDSYIKIGGQEVLQLTGSNFTFNGTNYATPVGSWNHLAFVRKDGTLYFYLNGVRQGSKAFSNVLTSAVQFSFGSSQQTYKYLDELRVTNFAVWESAFTPPTVPYDTNLSLVLPTDTVPVADEYWNISMLGTNLVSYPDFTNSSSLVSQSLSNIYQASSNYVTHQSYPSYSFNQFYYCSPLASVAFSVDGALISKGSYNGYFGYYDYYYRNNNNVAPFGAYLAFERSNLFRWGGTATFQRNYSNGPFTFSMVTSDGSVLTHTFNFNKSNFKTYSQITSNAPSFSSDLVSLGGYDVGFLYLNYRRQDSSRSDYYYFNDCYFVILPRSGSTSSSIISYVALEQGSISTVSAEFVSGIAGIPSDDLNTPTLAVRSDIPMPVSSGSFGGGREGSESTTGFNNLKSYQIGGVRPTFAERGYVYAMVESGFITSLQQYTGYAWQAVDGRIWTGSRWIPYSSYNVITLSDMYDIADASGQGGYEYIYSQSGFWSWWQKQWLEFKQWYTGINIGGGSGGDTNINVPIIAPDIDAEWDFSDDDLTFVDLLVDLPKTAFSTASGLLKTVGNTLKNVPLALNTFVVQGNPLNPAGAFKVFIIPGT